MSDSKKFNDLLQEYLKQQSSKTPNKPVKQKLSIQQVGVLNNRLDILLPQFKRAIEQKNLASAKFVVSDLQGVLRSLNKTTKLVEIKNQLFELALEENEYDTAIEGFLSNRKLVSSTTRLHLEATALLAIAYLRKSDVPNAKPYIKEVLQNKNVIKTESTREKFNQEIIKRFDEECALFAMKTGERIHLNQELLHDEVVKALKTVSESELYKQIGKSIPKSALDLLFEIDKFSKNQLSFKEQKLLPSPEEVIKDEHAGRTVFSAIKRVIYKSLCDPNSEVYKAWYTNAMGSVLDKRFITSAVGVTLSGYGIGVTALIISASALIIRFGLDVYCEKYAPKGITELRRKS